MYWIGVIPIAVLTIVSLINGLCVCGVTGYEIVGHIQLHICNVCNDWMYVGVYDNEIHDILTDHQK